MQNEITEIQVYECFCLFLISFSSTPGIIEIHVGIYNDFTGDACWGFYEDQERWHLQGTHHPTQAPTQTQVVGVKQGGKDQEKAGLSHIGVDKRRRVRSQRNPRVHTSQTGSGRDLKSIHM